LNDIPTLHRLYATISTSFSELGQADTQMSSSYYWRGRMGKSGENWV